MLWAYYACSVVLLGAEYVQVLREGTEPETGNWSGGNSRVPDLDAAFERWRRKAA